MVRISIWINSLIFAFFFLGCNSHTEKRTEKKSTSSLSFSYTTGALSSLYGTPKERQLYLITEEEDEFRTLVLKSFTDSIRSLRSVEVWEYTWQTNPIDSMITVWYLPIGDSLQYICHFKHSIYNLY